MLDSVTVADLPDGADAYLGYADGAWPTAVELRARFPRAHILILAVFAADDGEGLDIERFDASIPEVYDWFVRQQARGVQRPVLYISAGSAGMLLATMQANGFARSSWRLLSAHYGAGKHICGPGTCGYPQADGTQFTDTAPGLNGSLVDESLLSDSFFPAPPKPPHPATQETDVAMLATGTAAQTVIRFTAGSHKGLAFGNDSTLLSQPAPVVRIAAHSASGHWQVHTMALTASGSDEWAWSAADVDFVNVSRESGGAGDDVAVGWALT